MNYWMWKHSTFFNDALSLGLDEDETEYLSSIKRIPSYSTRVWKGHQEDNKLLVRPIWLRNPSVE